MPEWLTDKQVAEYLQVLQEDVDRWVDEGLLPAYEFVGERRFRREDVDALAEAVPAQGQQAQVLSPGERRQVMNATSEVRDEYFRAVDQLVEAGVISILQLKVVAYWLDGWQLEQIAQALEHPTEAVEEALQQAIERIDDAGLLQG